MGCKKQILAYFRNENRGGGVWKGYGAPAESGETQEQALERTGIGETPVFSGAELRAPSAGHCSAGESAPVVPDPWVPPLSHVPGAQSIARPYIDHVPQPGLAGMATLGGLSHRDDILHERVGPLR